ncbi:MAG: hypothetical protein NPINA01_32960 [Nitrospinaceae bacterium]|nr:MAG: hypothetical protein NPINA01_32960 [Nitrospinaceae bacterium]
MTHFNQEEIITFAKKVEKSLANKGARVAIVARVGQSPNDLPDGISYTHVAYWVYSNIQTSDGKNIRGYQIYNLYQRNEELDVSDLVNDFPVDYFAGVFDLKAGIVIPKPKLQKAILNVIVSDTYSKLHNPNYSIVASPFNNQYQNCTEFTLDILLSAVYSTDDMDQLKANAREYFTPQTVSLSPLKTLLGPIFVPDFTMRDHKDAIETTTFTTIKNFMDKYGLTQEAYSVN